MINIKIEKLYQMDKNLLIIFGMNKKKSEYILLLSGYAILEFEDFEIELLKVIV